MAKEFIKIKRVEFLPTPIKNELKEKGIFSGLVEIRISENSPKEVQDISQSYELFSQRLEASQ